MDIFEVQLTKGEDLQTLRMYFMLIHTISKMTKSLTVLNSLNSLEWSDMILTVWMGLESE